MDIKIYDFEVIKTVTENKRAVSSSDALINKKYERGEHRIITEQGSYKLNLLKDLFSDARYELQPDFQRRITWDSKKRSKLIESFIMNIPVPPVFLYEEDYSNYIVMDGLQRISAIIDFYRDAYSLTGLEEWPELNGRKYSQLPVKIKEGIDRRQLSTITLLKESSGEKKTADEMKRMVFERLNTGGVQLEDQEIRNALYQGPFNNCCSELSEMEGFKKLWRLNEASGKSDSIGETLDIEETLLAAKNRMIRRMYDVELVLRYFAMRTVQSFNGKLSEYLDSYLVHANKYSKDEIRILKSEFVNAINKADCLFGDKAFCIYREGKGWSQPQNMIYDAMMISLGNPNIPSIQSYDIPQNIKKMESFYSANEEYFNGRKQLKNDIITRVELISEFIIENIIK